MRRLVRFLARWCRAVTLVSAAIACGRSSLPNIAETNSGGDGLGNGDPLGSGDAVGQFGIFDAPQVLGSHAVAGATCWATGLVYDGTRFIAGVSCGQGNHYDDWRIWAYAPADDTWSELDLFNPPLMSEVFVGDNSLLRTASGALLSIGSVAQTDGHTQGYIRRSSDGGATWTTVDTPPPSYSWTTMSDMADGTILALGATWTTLQAVSLTRGSTDDGLTWNDIDAGPISTSASGAIIVGGTTVVANMDFTPVNGPYTTMAWSTRSCNGCGKTWSDSGPFLTGGVSVYQRLWPFTVTGVPGTFLAGDFGSTSVWRVAHAADNVTWGVVDDYQAAGPVAPTGRVVQHSSGATLLVGSWLALPSIGASALIRGTHDGVTWETIFDSSAAGVPAIGAIVGAVEMANGDLILETNYGDGGYGSVALIKLPLH